MKPPVSYSPEIAKEICERLGNGDTLTKVCADSRMPTRRAVSNWLKDESIPQFKKQYIQARKEQADWFADQILENANYKVPHLNKLKNKIKNNEILRKTDVEAHDVLVRDALNHARMLGDALKWRAAHQCPVRWGTTRKLTDKNKTTYRLPPLDLTKLDDESLATFLEIVNKLGISTG